MAYDVRAERADARQLAAIRATTTRQQLGQDIVALLDLVWPVPREQRDDDPARRRTDVYFLLEAPAG